MGGNRLKTTPNRLRRWADAAAVALLLVSSLGVGADGLELDDSAPFYPRRRGRPVFLLGASDRSALTIWRSDKGFDWRRYLEVTAAHGFNYVRQDVTAWTALADMREYRAQFSQARWAFARPGPMTAVDGLPRFDISRFDEGYFSARLVPFLRRAEQLGIIVELTLFDACRARRAFVQSPYSPANCVNSLGLRVGDDPCADAALRNPKLLAIQENYVRRAVAAAALVDNVIFEVANEAGGARWVEHFVDLIHRQRPGALVSAGEQSSAYDPVQGRCDLIVKHRGGAGDYRSDQDVARHRQSLIALRRGRKPVLHNEFFLYANRSTSDPNFVRKMFWADFTGGGHVNFYDFTWWRGTGRNGEGEASQPPPDTILDGGRHLRRFIIATEAPLAKMTPHDELASRTVGPPPFVLADVGETYIVYALDGGPFRLRMPANAGTFEARWFNPRTGDWLAPQRVAGAKVTFAPPGKGDWVLHLHRP